jgi:mannose/fructose-specific phosphotransferase system component IIA
MIGLVLVTHGRLAEELRLAMEHVVGPQRAVATVCIGPTTTSRIAGRRSATASPPSSRATASWC